MTARRNDRPIRASLFDDDALTLALRRDDWERASLLVLIAVATAIRNAPPSTIDDVLALLSADPDADGAQ